MTDHNEKKEDITLEVEQGGNEKKHNKHDKHDGKHGEKKSDTDKEGEDDEMKTEKDITKVTAE